MNTKAHWDERYGSRRDDELSWTESDPKRALTWILRHSTATDSVVDVGAGRSPLIMHLLEQGYHKPTYLELSSVATAEMQQRLADAAESVDWVCSSVLVWQPANRFKVWHDRAVFHFLTSEADRQRYVRVLEQALLTEGVAIIATFHTSGPLKCSGLPICQYTPESLLQEINRHAQSRWRLIESAEHSHTTPGGSQQNFQYSLITRVESE